MDLRSLVRDVPGFPKPGIVFKDITTLLKDAAAFRYAVNAIVGKYASRSIDVVAAVESRGFIFGAPIAYALGAGFVPFRKPGKLPAETVRESYALEYGTDSIEIHKDALRPGQRVLFVDDLLATGGTAAAAARLVGKLGAELVALAFVIELSFLKGRENLGGNSEVFSLIAY
jgi:adenine phosphoribosyltransferase